MISETSLMRDRPKESKLDTGKRTEKRPGRWSIKQTVWQRGHIFTFLQMVIVELPFNVDGR